MEIFYPEGSDPTDFGIDGTDFLDKPIVIKRGIPPFKRFGGIDGGTFE